VAGPDCFGPFVLAVGGVHKTIFDVRIERTCRCRPAVFTGSIATRDLEVYGLKGFLVKQLREFAICFSLIGILEIL
jgi:hypothetical protein